MRTVAELGEFDYEIQYRPGKDNEAADFLSRSSDLHKLECDEVENYRYLPSGLAVSQEIQGGGDSMFESLLIAMRDAKKYDGYNGEVPDDSKVLRESLVDELTKNWMHYGLTNGRQLRQKLKVMRREGQQPISEILLAASRKFGVTIHVYYGMKKPVIFNFEGAENRVVIRLQCISMIHYNPVCERGRFVESVKEGCVNVGVIGSEVEFEPVDIGEDIDVGLEIYFQENKLMTMTIDNFSSNEMI